MKNVALQLAHYNQISKWQPQLYDIVIYHGWFTHWFGIVNGIDGGVVSIVQAGLPLLLLTMDEMDIQKQTKKVGISAIRNSKAGKYTIQQQSASNLVWYV